MGFAEADGVGAVDDEDGGEWESPAGFGGVVIAEAGVVEGDVDEDGLEVAAVIGWNGVGDAEFFGDGGAGIGEQRVWQGVLLEGEVVLAGGLRGDGDEECAAFADFGVEVAPGFEFGDAVRIPAAAEEVDDERAEGEEIGGVDGLVRPCILRVKAGAGAPTFRMRSSMPVLKRSAVAFSEIARRSGWTRARVFCVMRSSWS